MAELGIEKKIIISLDRAMNCVWRCKVRFIVFSWIWADIRVLENWTEISTKFWNEIMGRIRVLMLLFLHMDTWIISAMRFISRAIMCEKFSRHLVRATLSKLRSKTPSKSRKLSLKSNKVIFNHTPKMYFPMRYKL